MMVLSEIRDRGVEDILIASVDGLKGFSEAIKGIFPNTDPIEAFNRAVRKVTKTKTSFRSDDSLFKLLYLVSQNIAEKWTMPIHNWSLIFQQLSVYLEGRLEKFL